MSGQPVRGLFIAGTSTAVGKTWVASQIVRDLSAAGLRVGVYKPAASGVEPQRVEATDAYQLWDAAGRPGSLEQVCPQQFAAPLAPHLAARAEGRRVDAKLLRTGLDYWRECSDVVIVEGAGGLLSPLGEEDFVADLAAEFGFPIVMVARDVLGTINETLSALVVAATYCDSLPLAGIVLNAPQAEPDPSCDSNFDELARRAVPPILARVAHGQLGFSPAVDWLALAQTPEES